MLFLDWFPVVNSSELFPDSWIRVSLRSWAAVCNLNLIMIIIFFFFKFKPGKPLKLRFSNPSTLNFLIRIDYEPERRFQMRRQMLNYWRNQLISSRPSLKWATKRKPRFQIGADRSQRHWHVLLSPFLSSNRNRNSWIEKERQQFRVGGLFNHLNYMPSYWLTCSEYRNWHEKPVLFLLFVHLSIRFNSVYKPRRRRRQQQQREK